MKTMKAAATAAIICGVMVGGEAFAAANSEWFGDAAISPDANSILFTYKGDIYKLSDIDAPQARGGTAVPLTVNDAWDGYPVWSHDGKRIAFASDRNGNLDIYVMSAEGGEARRLTFDSANDIPTDFTADDGAVTFSSSRMGNAASSLFPTAALPQLYKVRITVGTPEMILTTPARQARWNGTGDKLLYLEEKSLEDPLRKHDTSAFARDIWMYDANSGKHTRITRWEGGDASPVWGRGNNIFYLSDKGDRKGDRTFNVWRRALGDGSSEQLTDFRKHPVRHLTRAGNGTLAFVHDGSVYTATDKGQLRKLAITIATDNHGRNRKTTDVSDDISEFAVSPNGKEIAFVARGEVFVTATNFETTKRITDTPEQERGIDFSPDGKSLVYAAERDGRWRLMQATIHNDDEKYFFASTVVDEKVLHEGDAESFKPRYSPDGEKIAFIADRDTLKVLTIETGETVEVLGDRYNYSYQDGDIAFAWSPDSQWLTVDFIARQRYFASNVAIVPADGSALPRDISLSGYQNYSPSWHSKGAVIWKSNRYGMRDHGSWGSQEDVMATFLTRDAWDRFNMSSEERELIEEEEEDGAGEEPANPLIAILHSLFPKAEESGEEHDEPLMIEWDGMQDRTVRLTVHSSDLADMVLTRDADRLYYLARFRDGYDLWMRDLREQETELVARLNAEHVSLRLSDDEETAFVLADGHLSSLPLEPGQETAVSLSASMEIDGDAERRYFFEHIWRQMKEKFYTRTLHGVDWDGLKEDYRPKLESIGNNRDFARLMGEMLGELNASHTGAYYHNRMKDRDETGALGLILDLSDTSGPIGIEAVLDRGPLDKAASQVKPGMKLLAVDGTALGADVNLARLLNHKAGKRVRLTVAREDGSIFEEVMKPIDRRAQRELLYDRWAKSRRTFVENVSDGKIGYVHVRRMDDESYRQVYSDLLGRNFDKQAVVVDTRWNGGGWLHNDLVKLLSGRPYMNVKARDGRLFAGEPNDQWSKPSVVVMNEGNYSDAHAFPYAYKALGIGELVGMPVPGTTTAVWWETLHSGDITFGIPQVGQIDLNGNFLENQQLEPDYKVQNLPSDSAEGRDLQLRVAVEIMQEAVKAD